MVIPTYSFVSLHHLPSGGEHHGRGEQITDVTAVGPHGGVSQQPGGPVLYVENTSHAVLTLVISDNIKQIQLSPDLPTTSTLTSAQIVSSRWVRDRRQQEFDWTIWNIDLYSEHWRYLVTILDFSSNLKGIKKFRTKSFLVV